MDESEPAVLPLLPPHLPLPGSTITTTCPWLSLAHLILQAQTQVLSVCGDASVVSVEPAHALAKALPSQLNRLLSHSHLERHWGEVWRLWLASPRAFPPLPTPPSPRPFQNHCVKHTPPHNQCLAVQNSAPPVME